MDATIEQLIEEDRAFLKDTQIPIVTVSAAFQEDLKGIHHLPEDETIQDVVYSRAHYSMALATLVEAWGPHRNKSDEPLNDYSHPDRAWLVDPTNYVGKAGWKSIALTELIGKTIARWPVLQQLKAVIDSRGRSKLPILDSITAPLLELTHQLNKPVLSFHIAAGNLLAGQGHTVLQMVTDPHVRPEYVMHADKKNFYYAVFDDATFYELLEVASIHGKNLDGNRVIVTGPPVDPRIVAARKEKQAWRNGPLKLCLTTGGLGTNKRELAIILDQLLPVMRRSNEYQLLVYAGTHADIAKMVEIKATHHHIKIESEDNSAAKLRLLHHPQIVDANELLIKHAFPWSHGFITKPSGDMAYDAAASGSFILTLSEWGEWEHNVREVFEQKGISRKAEIHDIVDQLLSLTTTANHHLSWVEQAMTHAFKLDSLFLEGAKNIVASYKQLV